MSSFQTMRKKCLLWATLIFVCLNFQFSYAQVTDKLPLEDPNTVIQSIISALKTIEHPQTGRGRAMMKMENFFSAYNDKDLTVDFVFKNQSSRVDFFETNESLELSRISAKAVSDKASIYSKGMSTAIERPELYDYHVGRDFHPDSFFKVLGLPLTEWLKSRIENNKIKKFVKIDNEGILQLLTTGHVITPSDKEYVVDTQIWFDTKSGFRPVYYDRKFKYPDGYWHGIEVNLTWIKTDSIWYVSSFEYNELPSNHAHIKGTIESFTPNIEVSDQEFTLDGMDIPDGVLVGDKIAGVTYRYEAHKAQQQKETSVEEVKATIRNKIIPALEALEAKLPTSGRGTTIMETENYLPWFDGKELTMDFVFKGQNSRWDAIEWVDGNKSSRLWTRVAADKYMVTLASDDTVTVNRAKVHDFFRNDFHPVSFVSFKDYLLRSQLQDILDYDLVADPEKYASADLDDNGILHIVNGGPVTRPKGLYFEHQMSFDTKRELVPFPLNKFQFC